MSEKDLEERFAGLEEENRRLEWRVNHARSQYHMFLEKALPLLDGEAKRSIFIELGRNCARSTGWGEKYRGDPEGFFAFMKGHSNEDIRFNDDGSGITVITARRPCDCPLMKGRCLEGSYCSCSIGWQSEIYETILDRKVAVEVREAVFRGADRCVFEISLK